jgi:hypothetical protein
MIIERSIFTLDHAGILNIPIHSHFLTHAVIEVNRDYLSIPALLPETGVFCRKELTKNGQ